MKTHSKLKEKEKPATRTGAYSSNLFTPESGSLKQDKSIRNILSSPVQKKVPVGKPGDQFEREADTVADKVSAGETVPLISRVSTFNKIDNQTQGEVNTEDSNKRLQVKSKTTQEDEEKIQTKSNSSSPSSASEASGVSSTINNKDAGSPINPATRQTLESGIGADFSEVRVHDDSRAKNATRDLNARAFTYKNDIWLGEGESQTDTKLMAHEATHVVQQSEPPILRKQPARDKQAEALKTETQLEMLQTGELGRGIEILVNRVGQLPSFVVNQIDIDFSGAKLDKLKKRLSEEQLQEKKIKPWRGGGAGKESTGLERGKSYSFSEGQMWSRLDFVATMSGSLGSVDRVFEHFAAVKQAQVPGTVWLHVDAATRLEATCHAFGKNQFPFSFVAMQLRGRHQERHSRGMLMHPVGYAIDFRAVDNPMLTDKGLHTLLGAVGEGPTHMKLTNSKGKELGHSARDKIIIKLGQQTMSGVEASKRDPQGLKLLNQVDQAYARMVGTSQRFQQSLADTPEKRAEVLTKLEKLQSKYHSETIPIEENLRKAQSKEAASLRAIKRAELKESKAYYKWGKADNAYWKIPSWNPRYKKALRKADDRRWKAYEAWGKTQFDLEVARNVYRGHWQTGTFWITASVKRQLSESAEPISKELKVLLAPILTRLNKKIIEARKNKSDAEVKSLEQVKIRLTTDFKFVFGSTSAADVKDPPVLQLLQKGFVQADKPSPKGTAPKNMNRLFNSSFIKEMMRHGFEPGAAWRGSTDTMHFNFSEGKSGVKKSSPATGLDLLMRFLIRHSGTEAGPDTTTSDDTKPA